MVRRIPSHVLIAAFVVLTFAIAPFSSLAQKVSPVAPSRAQAEAVVREAYENIVEDIISDNQLGNVHFDISWDEVAKYVVATPESVANAAAVVNRHPDRFLFGTDEVAPSTQEKYLRVYNQYQPFWKLLTPEASEKVRKGNYVRIFDAARQKVRAWEAAHLNSQRTSLSQ